MDGRRNSFEAFNRRSPKKSESTAQTILDYEEHYMRLLKNFRPEIEFINEMHERHTREVKNFYDAELPAIVKKLEAEPIADDVRREWLKHLERHIDNSFRMSGHFIDILTTKKVEEFNAMLREKIFGGSTL